MQCRECHAELPQGARRCPQCGRPVLHEKIWRNKRLRALLIGIEVIGKVPATLHTPLMSGANSIHGIVIAGVVIVAAHATSPLAWVFIFLAAVLGTMNVVGGYVVTDRMLEMFKSDKGKKKEEEAK